MNIQVQELEGGCWKATYKDEVFYATSEAGALKKLVEAYPATTMDKDNPLCLDCDPIAFPKCSKCLGC